MRFQSLVPFLVMALWLGVVGCRLSPNHVASIPAARRRRLPPHRTCEVRRTPSVDLVAHEEPVADEPLLTGKPPLAEIVAPVLPVEPLSVLEQQALTGNPLLRQLRHEAAAARSKANYVGALPDPTLSANIFGYPIETAAGAQRATMTLTQMLPWLSRLDAQTQQACFEALAVQQEFAAGRLQVIGDLRAAWYRLYVIDRQIETQLASQRLLESLINVANGRVSTGKASQGDVLIGTLEYASLEERLLTLRQQRVATAAMINRLVGRAAAAPIASPPSLEVQLPRWSHPVLRQLAWENQPEIAAAQLRAQATRWGIEVARLRRRPDFSLSGSWYAIDDNRPPSTLVDVGRDAWAIGGMATIPLWHRKYDAIGREASFRHASSHASVEAARDRYDALLLDLWAAAQAAERTATLYQDTILPQAEDTLEADQQSYANDAVEFDRVVGDFRNLLTLELGYHQSVGRLATAIARIREATGTDLAIE